MGGNIFENFSDDVVTFVPDPKIGLRDVITSVESKPAHELDLDDRVADAEQALKERETKRVGAEKYYVLRDTWSFALRELLRVSIYFQVLLTVFVGLGVLNFVNYQTFLMLVVGENFLQITGMGFIIVKFLFPKLTPEE